jgi:hypothetical protein
MAFHILIDKIDETSADVTYRFYESAYPSEVGEFMLNKGTGDITLTKPTRDAWFTRAAMKITRHFRDGNIPESAEWAS